MKRQILISVILSTICLITEGQTLSISSFKQDPKDYSAIAPDTKRADFSGRDCALIKISTKLTGLSFDSGMEYIADVVYNSPGVWIYLPTSAKYITISHSTYGTINRWHFPTTLESGKTYGMTLKAELPKKEYVFHPKPIKIEKPKPVFNTDGFSSHFLQGHLGMEINNGTVDCAVFGLSYSFMPGRWGFTTSFDWSECSGFALFAGPSVRMLDNSSFTDWQLYACPGYVIGSSMAVDIGTRFGWKTDKVLSRYDFSIGCQYWGKNTFVPYVGLGAEITGYSVAVVLGLILCVAGGVL